MKGTAPRRGKVKAVGALVDQSIRRAGQTRGFSEAKLLTRWTEFAGRDIAAICRPVKVTHSRAKGGATLVLLTTGANAPQLQMQLPRLRDKVNACYGYNAIQTIQLTQTAPTGFAEGQAQFTARPKMPQAPSPEIAAKAKQNAAGVSDDGLRAALERLGENIISKSSRPRIDPNG